MFQNIVSHIADLIKLNPEILWKIIASAVILVILWILRLIGNRIVNERTDDPRIRYGWRKGIGYSAFIVGFFLLLRIWVTGFGAVTTYLGLLSAGIAIALKDPLVNLAGWLFILWRRPFTVGDRVQLGQHQGDVIDLRIFQFTLLEIGNWVDADQSTGRVIRIPNGKVFTEMLANYSKGFAYIWNEIGVLVTFESNWRRAKEILEKIANEHAEHLTEEAQRRVREASQKLMIFYTKLTPTVYTSVKDSGVMLTIRYLTEPRRRRGSSQVIWESILDEFAKCDDIDFAYPTQRFYSNRSEGKSGARADGDNGPM